MLVPMEPRNRTRRCNGYSPFKYLCQQPHYKGKVLCQRHATVRPYGRILPVRVKSALAPQIFLSFYRRWRPPSARSQIKTSCTPQRCRPRHVNNHVTGPVISNGSGGRRNLLRLSRCRPPTKHVVRPWSRPGSYPDNNGQLML